MNGFSRGFVAPGAVIFLAVIGFITWYRNHEAPSATASIPVTANTEMRLSGEGRTSSIR